MLAKIAQRDAGRQVVADEIDGRLRQEDLAAMPGREQTGDAMNGRTNVAARACLNGAGVERHPYVLGSAGLRRLVHERALPGDGRGEPIGGGLKRGPDRLRADLIVRDLNEVSPAALDRVLEQPPLAIQRTAHGIRILFPLLGAVFDGGEEKGDRPRRGKRHRQQPRGQWSERTIRPAGRTVVARLYLRLDRCRAAPYPDTQEASTL